MATRAPSNRGATSRPLLRGRRDGNLRSLAARGDPRAFAELYEAHHQALYRYCRSIVGHDEDARDALHSTMTRALAALADEERDFELKPWLFRIAHNESVSILRKRRETRELDALADVATRSLDHELNDREDLELLRADLAELPERQRATLVLRELSGLSHEEIGTTLDMSPSAVKQAIFEARSALLEFREGREMACAQIRRVLSDGDGRALRGRKLRGHLRNCGTCRQFRADLERRPAAMAALAPPLPAAVAAALLHDLIGSAAASGTGAAAGAGAGAVIGGKAGAVAGGSATVAGGGGAAVGASTAASGAGAAAVAGGSATVTGGLAAKVAVAALALGAGGGSAAVIRDAVRPASPPPATAPEKRAGADRAVAPATSGRPAVRRAAGDGEKEAGDTRRHHRAKAGQATTAKTAARPGAADPTAKRGAARGSVGAKDTVARSHAGSGRASRRTGSGVRATTKRQHPVKRRAPRREAGARRSRIRAPRVQGPPSAGAPAAAPGKAPVPEATTNPAARKKSSEIGPDSGSPGALPE